MEVKLVLIELLKVFLNVVEVLKSLSQEPLTDEGLTAFDLVPHALHVVHVESLILACVLAK